MTAPRTWTLPQEAVDAALRLAGQPRCSDWGEKLTEARVRALLEAAAPFMAVREVQGPVPSPEQIEAGDVRLPAPDHAKMGVTFPDPLPVAVILPAAPPNAIYGSREALLRLRSALSVEGD